MTVAESRPDTTEGRLRGALFAQDVDYPKTLIHAAGAFLALAIVSFLSLDVGCELLVASFGASTVILFAMPGSRAARPRNAFFGQVLSAVIGVALFMLIGSSWLSIALGVTLAILAMTVTDTVHPPGGATVIACMTSASAPTWMFVLTPVALGILVIIAVAVATGYVYGRFAGAHSPE